MEGYCTKGARGEPMGDAGGGGGERNAGEAMGGAYAGGGDMAAMVVGGGGGAWVYEGEPMAIGTEAVYGCGAAYAGRVAPSCRGLESAMETG